MNTTHRRKLSSQIYLTITLTLLFVLVLLGAAYAYYYSNPSQRKYLPFGNPRQHIHSQHQRKHNGSRPHVRLQEN